MLIKFTSNTFFLSMTTFFSTFQPLLQFTERSGMFSISKMRFDDLSELRSAKQPISQGQEIEDGLMEEFPSVAEEGATQLNAFAVVAFVVRKLNEHHQFHERIEVDVALLLRTAVGNLLQHALETCFKRKRLC